MPALPTVTSSADIPSGADAVVVAVQQTDAGPRLMRGAAAVDAALGRRLAGALRALHATGAAGETFVIPALGLAPFDVVVAAGAGRRPDAEAVRRAVGAATRRLAGYRAVHIAIDGPVGAIAEGALLGAYAFSEYKSDPPPPPPRRVTIGADASRRDIAHARAVATAVNLTRDLVNSPPNELYPQTFAARALSLAADAGLEVDLLDERDLARDGYGGILAVGAGSARPPRLVRLHYRPARPRGRVALVGKGVTYDSGGLNLKSANLTWMKSDMAGAAAMIATTVAAASLRLPLEVTATVPMAENMPGGGAYRPSDVLHLRSGRAVEITDTDYEGRLVLADAISRALEDEPDWLVEASTLTAAQLVALGTRVIAAMGEPGLRDLVAAAGSAAGEAVWAMPLPDDLRAGLDSPVADLVNAADDRWGSMLVGGHFLAEFMSPDVPWVHLDIAGPAWNPGPARDYTPRGGTGAAVRTVLATLERLSD